MDEKKAVSYHTGDVGECEKCKMAVCFVLGSAFTPERSRLLHFSSASGPVLPIGPDPGRVLHTPQAVGPLSFPFFLFSFFSFFLLFLLSF